MMEAILKTTIEDKLEELLADNPEAVIDEETWSIVDGATGEVLQCWECPEPTLNEREIAEWVGERRVRANARLAGLIAEKEAWLAKVAAQFDGQIRRKQKYVEHLDTSFAPLLERLAHQQLEGKKERSCRIGLLTLRFRKTRAHMDVVNEELALEWVRVNCPKAIKVRESILKGMLLIATVEDAGYLTSGIEYHEGGEDEFIIS